MKPTTTAIAGWFGGNRLLAPRVGAALEGCNHVVILFAGGMCEVPHITARTILVNDAWTSAAARRRGGRCSR
jgi:hypothetical protein